LNGKGNSNGTASWLRGHSPLAMGAKRFLGNRAAVGSLILLALMSAACFVTSGVIQYVESGAGPGGSMVFVSKDEEQSVGRSHPWPPSWRHPFGTDTNGRDLLLRTLQGGTISLVVGLAAAAISIFIGTFYGAISGQAGGSVDRWMMRIVDTLYGLPYILLVILLLVYAQQKFWVLFIAIGLVTWLTMARIVRGQVLRLREEEYVLAARALGAGPIRILVHHMLPNLLGPIIVCGTLTVPVAILQESFLSFLGLGVSSPQTSWGTLASEAVEAVNPIVNYWWLLFFPCLFLGLTLLGLNFLGDGLRDAFDPKTLSRKGASAGRGQG
jgi:oligopeptide transport system permease protein